MLVKVHSTAVHKWYIYLDVAFLAIEIATSHALLKNELSKVLVGVYKIPCALVTVMRDLKADGYEELSFSKYSTRAAAQRAVVRLHTFCENLFSSAGRDWYRPL